MSGIILLNRPYRFNIAKLLAAVLLIALPMGAMAKPDEVSADYVAHCQYLNKVEGSSGYGKHNGWQTLAKHSAIKKAGSIGASHIVWERFSPVGGFNGIAVAKAYNCGQ